VVRWWQCGGILPPISSVLIIHRKNKSLLYQLFQKILVQSAPVKYALIITALFFLSDFAEELAGDLGSVVAEGAVGSIGTELVGEALNKGAEIVGEVVATACTELIDDSTNRLTSCKKFIEEGLT
jgi:hypothetical protein